MNDYELVVLYHPDLEIDLEKALKKVEKILTDQKGEITNTDNWGKRKLAYPIKKQDHAIYVYYDVQLDPLTIAKIESTLNITDEVLRYLISKPLPRPEGLEDAESATEEGADDSEKAEKTANEEEE